MLLQLILAVEQSELFLTGIRADWMTFCIHCQFLYQWITQPGFSAPLTSIDCQVKLAGFHDLTRKVLILVLVGTANIPDIYLLKNGSATRVATISFYIFSEGIFLLENTSRFGLPVPDRLKGVLQRLHNKDNQQ